MRTSASIYIICGSLSGLGHTRRSLTLAKALRAQGVDCTIHVSDPMAHALVEQFGFVAKPWEGDPSTADIGIVDCGVSSSEILRDKFQGNTLTCLIDDMATSPVRADAIINPNLYADGLDYSDYESSHLFLGPNFHLVDAAFLEASTDAALRAGIVVSFGGTDTGNLAMPVIEALLDLCDRDIAWPIPAAITPDAEIVALANRRGKFQILVDCDIPDLLVSSEIYVGSAGATLLEALGAGCKFAVSSIVENQKINVGYLLAKGYPALVDYDAEKISTLAVQTLAKDRASGFTLGAGPDVIAARLIKLATQEQVRAIGAG